MCTSTTPKNVNNELRIQMHFFFAIHDEIQLLITQITFFFYHFILHFSLSILLLWFGIKQRIELGVHYTTNPLVIKDLRTIFFLLLFAIRMYCIALCG